MPINNTEFDEIILEQGSYWRAAAAVDLPGVHRDDRETPMTIPSGTVLLLQSIRDVDNTAHTIVLRPHPSVDGLSVKLVIEYRDGEPHSWTWGELTECRFLVADFLAKFVPAPDAERVRAEELAAAQEYVRLLQRRLIEGQSDPDVSAASVADKPMLPDLLHGEERKVWGDGGYQGQTDVIKEAVPKAQDMTCKRTKFKHYVDELQKKKNRSTSSACQGGACVPHTEAHLRLRQGQISRHR